MMNGIMINNGPRTEIHNPKFTGNIDLLDIENKAFQSQINAVHRTGKQFGLHFNVGNKQTMNGLLQEKGTELCRHYRRW